MPTKKGQQVTENRLSDFPEIAAQWHPSKNGNLTPNEIPSGSVKKYWWKCDKGPDHEWLSEVRSRTVRSTNCPFCANLLLSVTNSLASVNPQVAAQWHPTKNGDVAPNQVRAFSGNKFWWKCDKGPDHEWVRDVRARAIREAGCPFCLNDRGSVTNSLAALHPEIAAQWHPTKNGDFAPDQVPTGSAKRYWWKCDKGLDHEWEAMVNSRTGKGYGCPFCAGNQVSETNSLSFRFPEIAATWHPTKNGDSTPAQITAGSDKKFWWKCDKAPDHEWEAAVKDRTKFTGCPFCAGQRVSQTNSLASLFPEIAAQWHPTKNGDLTPDQITAGSGKKYWWKCDKGPDHEWAAVLKSRTHLGAGCPSCYNRQASVTNSLSLTNPVIAAQWHPTKNGDLTSDKVPAGSTKKYWWKCDQGSDHEWEAAVKDRTRVGHGCPFCAGQRVSQTNSLASLFPEIAAQWHPTKNGDLTPDQITAGSGKKYWWKCDKGPDHEWQSWLQDRTRAGVGCPRCNVGWTVQAIRSFVESLRPHLQTFTPAELYLLFQQNGLLATTGKGKAFVRALATGRFPIDEVDRFIEGEESLVNKFLDRAENYLENSSANAGGDQAVDDERTNGEAAPVEVLTKHELPALSADDVLGALDSHVLSSADQEAAEFLIASAVAKLWKLAYRDETAAITQAQAFIGGEYALQARDRFLMEVEQARALPIPEHYSFRPNGRLAEPNLMQRHFAARVLNQRRVGNWSGTGAGKTLSAIYASRLADARFTVICCPNSVVSGWASNIRTIFPNSDIVTKTWQPQWSGSSPYRYLILNYEAFQQQDSAIRVKELSEAENINFVVVDEIHYAKQRTAENLSRRRELVNALTSLAGQKNPGLHVLGMSATPVINNLMEGRSLIDLITGLEHDDLEVSVPNVANCMRIHQRLVTLGIRWMPEYALAYQQVEVPAECSADIEEIRALGKSGSPLELEKILTRARLPAILSGVRRKTVIYTHYVQGIDRILRDALVEAGWTVGFYTGEDKSGLEAFIEGDLDVLIGSSAISTGVDRLQHVCNRLIVNVLPWTAAEFEQLKGRIFRQGQVSNQVTMVIPLTYAEVNGVRWSWCEAKMQRLRYKKSVADAVVDGVVPEGHLRSPAQAYQDVLAWLERLESGVMGSVARKPVAISLDEIGEHEEKRSVRLYGDFSEMNRRWNVSHSETTAKRLAGDPQEWEQYHHLYREARKEWALVPFEEFIRWAEKRSGYSIGDFGCGEALVAKSLAGAHTVYSFDHVAINAEVVECDMAKVPLDDESLDVALYCLSLMGTNVSDYLTEAYRVLKLDGHLHIWEPTSRLGDLTAFKASLKALGFDLLSEVSEWKFTHLHLLKNAKGAAPDTVVTFNTRRKSPSGESA